VRGLGADGFSSATLATAPRGRINVTIDATRRAPHHVGTAPVAARRPRVPSAVVTERLDYFARLVADDPTVARARFAYANELLHAERWEEAVTQLRAYLELTEDEGNAWGRLAEALTKLGRPDEAADAYLTGIDQSLKHGHTGMAADFEAAVQEL
jgi:predicted Zn-dependent protease